VGSQQRDELRRLQDRFLGLWVVKEYARVHGTGYPLWQGGPCFREVQTLLWPQWEAEFRWHLEQGGVS
jgi:hypothetical protein